MMNPIMAKRPFQVSAKEENLHLLPIASLGNLIILLVFLCCCCAKWINRTHIPYLWAVRGLDSTQDPPGWKRSRVSSQPVARYRFGIWSWCWSKSLTDVPCIPEVMDFGRIPRLQVAFIGATCSALRCRWPASFTTPTAVTPSHGSRAAYVLPLPDVQSCKSPDKVGAFAHLGRTTIYRANYFETVALEAKNTFWSSARGHLPSRQPSEREECIGPSIPSKDDLASLTEGFNIVCDKYFQLMWHAAQLIITCEALGGAWLNISKTHFRSASFPFLIFYSI